MLSIKQSSQAFDFSFAWHLGLFVKLLIHNEKIVDNVLTTF